MQLDLYESKISGNDTLAVRWIVTLISGHLWAKTIANDAHINNSIFNPKCLTFRFQLTIKLNNFRNTEIDPWGYFDMKNIFHETGSTKDSAVYLKVIYYVKTFPDLRHLSPVPSFTWKCLYSKFFWPALSRIWSKCADLLRAQSECSKI